MLRLLNNCLGGHQPHDEGQNLSGQYASAQQFARASLHPQPGFVIASGLFTTATSVGSRMLCMKTTVVVAVLAVVAQSALGQSAQSASAPVKVPDAATAVTLAEKILGNVYGKKKIEAEEPFEASLYGSIWHVGGTLYCGKGRLSQGNQCAGGVAMIDIRQRDGHVVKIWHTK
jgi:hypothetical protein